MNSEETIKDKNKDLDTAQEDAPEIPVENTENETQKNDQEHWPEDEVVNNHELKLKEEKDKYLRLYSEYENFRKRTAREKMDLLQMAGKEVIMSMLPVLDDFDRALKSADSTENHKAVVEGFELIYKKMFGALQAMGLKAMNTVGETFDAEIHEAVTKIAAPSEKEKGKVVDELEKGYYLNEKVIRFAKVVVGE